MGKLLYYCFLLCYNIVLSLLKKVSLNIFFHHLSPNQSLSIWTSCFSEKYRHICVQNVCMYVRTRIHLMVAIACIKLCSCKSLASFSIHLFVCPSVTTSTGQRRAGRGGEWRHWPSNGPINCPSCARGRLREGKSLIFCNLGQRMFSLPQRLEILTQYIS